jgi:DNA-binding response OmpR family regulator
MLDNMGRNALIEVGSMVPHPCNVLLVDDADNDRMLFKIAFDQVEPKQLRLLKPLKNGAEAISYLAGCVPFADRQAFPYPDLLILDLKMPLKNGFDVLEWLRNQPMRPTVIILSDSSQKTDKDRAFSLGATDYYVKPNGLPELVAMISRMETTWCRTALRPLPAKTTARPHDSRATH